MENLSFSRSLEHSPVFQAMFAWQSQEEFSLNLQGIEATLLDQPQAEAKFDLTLSLAPRADGSITGNLEYDASLFAPATVKRWLAALPRLLAGMVEAPDAPVASLEILGADEIRHVLEDFNDTAVALPAHPATLVELFEAQVARSPEAIALVFQDERLTYARLDAKANQLARLLRARDLGPESLVALALERSVNLIVAILAVLKTGAAYLPLDPEYPQARLEFMLRDSGARLLLTTGDVQAKIGLNLTAVEGACATLLLDAASTVSAIAAMPTAQLTDAERTQLLYPQNLAYCIYTSGSTGTPKGVVLTHAGAVNMAHALGKRFNITPSDRVLQFASPAFDAAVAEIFVTLACGASLILPTTEVVHDPARLGAFLHKTGVTQATLPPALLAGLGSDIIAGMNKLVVAGEACPPELVQRIARGRCMVNAYGPTESTVCTSISQPLDADRDSTGSVPIGTPIANANIFILDPTLNPVPVGVTGEL